MFSKLENLWWRVQSSNLLAHHTTPETPPKRHPISPTQKPSNPIPSITNSRAENIDLRSTNHKKSKKKKPNLLEKSLSTHIALITNPPRENSPFPISRSPCPPIRHRTPSTEPLHRKTHSRSAAGGFLPLHYCHGSLPLRGVVGLCFPLPTRPLASSALGIRPPYR